MGNQGTNIFIVDDNNLVVITMKQYLQNRFGESMHIRTFNDGESCLEKVDKDTDIVILDYHMEGKNGLDVLKSIKAINPKTEVIMLSSNEDTALAIETFNAGAAEYVIKGSGAWKKVTTLVHHIVTAPIRIMVREFSISKQVARLLTAFIAIGIVVFFAFRIIR